MSNEVLVKQERNAWAVVLKALAEARSPGALTAGSVNPDVPNGHVIPSDSVGTFQLSDLNNLMTLMKRINTSYAGGTTTDTYGLTDLFVSPEVKADIRAFAYNAFTTVGAQGTNLPDGVREEIYRNAGVQEIYGVTIHELVELGTLGKYNALYQALRGVQTSIANNSEIAVGLDLSREGFIRPVARQAESGGTFNVLPDDQFVTRSEKTGFYGFLEEGRVCIDARTIVGLRVKGS
jgi:hypothetical protein